MNQTKDPRPEPIPLDPTEGLMPYGPGNANAAYNDATEAAMRAVLPDESA